MSTDDIAGAWKQQLTNGFTAANGTTYTHEQMAEMFIDKSTSTSSTVWAKLSKVFTPGSYAYLTDASNFNSVPTATGDPYQDMHRALANNSLCTGWNPNHRTQFKHSKGDMVVPYGNYLAYKDAHDGEGTRYRVDNSFSTDDHQAAGFSFFLGLRNWNGDFQWLDGSPLEWSGSGTEADPYVINNTDEWQLLVDSVSAGNNYSGKFFRLGDDISVTTMVGTSGFTFNGTFDGNGHTLNVTFSGSGTDNTAGTAPFKYISGATIKNLHVTGSISTTGMRPASIASFVVENSTIINCWSEVAISSSYNKDIDAGGFVSRVNQNKSVTLTGCVFTGSITYSNETGYEGGGMVGYTQSGATATLNNCLFAPSAISITKYNTTGDDWKKHWMFVGGEERGTYTNCYYNDVAATAAEAGMVAENKLRHSITVPRRLRRRGDMPPRMGRRAARAALRLL